MQTVSSASRTFIALASAVECTATVLIPISRQARWMRSAISPRLAIRTLSNIQSRVWLLLGRCAHDMVLLVDKRTPHVGATAGLLYRHQNSAILDGLGIGNEDLRDAA